MSDGPLRSSATPAEPAIDVLIGRVIAGKFSIDERLGAGAMGMVYRARQLALDRTVALKVLHRQFAADDDFASRFWGEAKVASRLDHPNSIRVIDFGQEPDGLLYLVMELVEGRNLFELISERGPLPPTSIVAVLSQVLAALAVAHDIAVVHRDLKPENIMIVHGKSDDGQPIDLVKVCDFGIAKILDSAPAPDRASRPKHSTSGLMVGTPAYMSPEQARGEKLDARSDLYSVGVVLYELLAGKVPFDGESLIAVALKHATETPVPPSSVAHGVDPDLEAICLRAMSKKPMERFQDAREMRLALLSAASKPGFGGQATGLVVADPTRSTPRRYGSGKPTFSGVTPEVPASRAKRSRAWLAILVLPVASIWALAHFRASPVSVPSSGAPATNTLPTSPALAQVKLAAADQAPLASSSSAASAASGARSAFGLKPRHAKGAPAQPAASERDARTPVGATAPAFAPAPIAESLAAPPAQPAQPIAPAPSPSPSPSPPPPPPPAFAPAAAPAPAYDLQAAHVLIGSARNAVGTTPASVTRAVAEASSRITACYKTALPQLNGALEGAGALHIETDGSGIITEARLSSAIRGSVASCVAAAVQGHRVANVDTGTASGDVPLSFRAH
jgi:serine/threonine-protein kinase